MNDKIFIVSFYDYYKLNENRISSPAAINKIDYVAKVLSSHYQVNIISPSWTNNKKIYTGKRINIDNNIYLKLFTTFPWISLLKIPSFIIAYIQFFIFLLFNVRKNENVIVYHSLYLVNVIKLLKKIKRFNLILEVEEIYSDLIDSKRIKKKEYKFFEISDKFIFITNLLQEKINKDKKPYAIVHGKYFVEEKICKKFNDNKIHIVYSGVIDTQKKGAYTSCDISNYLSEKYVIHIIGFGKDIDIEILKERINQYNKKNPCKILYDGLKKGNDYIGYLQKCDVGLSTQNPNAAYNDTSFPSKILSYMSCGLRVVTVDIPAIKTSDVSDYLYYYKNDDPREIAEIIKSIDFSEKYDSKKILNDLNNNFTQKIMEVLNE